MTATIAPPKPAELTVVITAHNRADIIDQTLHSLAQQTWDNGTWTILLVDNDSTDNTPQILRDWAPKMPVPTRILTATNGHSPAYARNAAVAETTTPNIAFIDDDDLIAPGWVAAIGTALRTHEFVASRSDYELLNDPSLAKTATFQTERLGKHFGAEVVDSAGSGCRRALWERLGGSNESLTFAEDADFSLRVARLGTVTPVLCHDAVCHVRLRSDLGSAFRRGGLRGEGEVELYRLHGEAFDISPDPVLVTIGRWLRLIPQLRWVLSGRQAHWVEQYGRRVGRARGSIKQRVWFP